MSRPNNCLFLYVFLFLCRAGVPACHRRSQDSSRSFPQPPHIGPLPFSSEDKRNVLLFLPYDCKCIQQEFQSLLPVNSRKKKHDPFSARPRKLKQKLLSAFGSLLRAPCSLLDRQRNDH